MAKKSKPTGRDLFIPSPIARAPALPRFPVSPVNLALFEDRRSFHPLGPYRPAFSLPRSAAVVRVPQAPRTRKSVDGAKARTHSPQTLVFSAPDRVLICVRRKRRKQVLHAKGVAGSKKRMHKPKRNYWSSISCKR